VVAHLRHVPSRGEEFWDRLMAKGLTLFALRRELGTS
jgi:hypothetical protein